MLSSRQTKEKERRKKKKKQIAKRRVLHCWQRKHKRANRSRRFAIDDAAPQRNSGQPFCSSLEDKQMTLLARLGSRLRCRDGRASFKRAPQPRWSFAVESSINHRKNRPVPHYYITIIKCAIIFLKLRQLASVTECVVSLERISHRPIVDK